MHVPVFLVVAFLVCVVHSQTTTPKPCVILKNGVDAAAKQTILKKHNDLRAKLANGNEPKVPFKAADMMEMIWDDQNAQKAQDWANKCVFKHDKPDERQTGRGQTGQNIAFQGNKATTPDWDSAIQMLYDEVAKFDVNNIDKYVFDYPTGHFTQVIWAKSNKVGCGYVMYQGDNGYNNHMYVCNYLPSGNYGGMSIFVKGDPCTKCPNGCGSTPGLCKS